MTLGKINKCLVLFSGGRDSTLVAARSILRGDCPILLSLTSGCSQRINLLPTRIEDLKHVFGDHSFHHLYRDIGGLFKRIALDEIESDFSDFKVNLILLGESVAIHCAALGVCRALNIGRIEDGSTRYQSNLAEQKIVAQEWFRENAEAFGVQRTSPIYEEADSRIHVQRELTYLGLSAKSLEGTTLFANTFSEPTDDIVRVYLGKKRTMIEQAVARVTELEKIRLLLNRVD